MEFETFKQNVEKICGLNAQLDCNPTLNYLENKIEDLNFKLSKYIKHSLRSYFVVTSQNLIETLKTYFINKQLDCVIQSSSNSIVISVKDKKQSTYFLDRNKQNLDMVNIPLFHINGGLLEFLTDYPDIYDIFWDFVEQKYLDYETEISI